MQVLACRFGSQVWSRQKVAEAALMPFKTYRKSNWKFLMCTVTQLVLPLCSCCFCCCTQLFCCYCCCCTDKLQLTLSAFYATLRAASQPESEINVWKVKCISACVQGTVTHAHTYYVCTCTCTTNTYAHVCVRVIGAESQAPTESINVCKFVQFCCRTAAPSFFFANIPLISLTEAIYVCVYTGVAPKHGWKIVGN